MRRLKFRDFQEIFKLRAGYVGPVGFYSDYPVYLPRGQVICILIIMFEEKCHGAIKV